jgi:uncharacterized membrane protein YesL
MTVRKEFDKSIVSFSVSTLVWCCFTIAGLLISGTWTVAVQLTSINRKLDSAWTIEDAQRARNWLRQDNVSIGLIVRDTDDVIRARYAAR